MLASNKNTVILYKHSIHKYVNINWITYYKLSARSYNSINIPYPTTSPLNNYKFKQLVSSDDK